MKRRRKSFLALMFMFVDFFFFFDFFCFTRNRGTPIKRPFIAALHKFHCLLCVICVGAIARERLLDDGNGGILNNVVQFIHSSHLVARLFNDFIASFSPLVSKSLTLALFRWKAFQSEQHHSELHSSQASFSVLLWRKIKSDFVLSPSFAFLRSSFKNENIRPKLNERREHSRQQTSETI